MKGIILDLDKNNNIIINRENAQDLKLSELSKYEQLKICDEMSYEIIINNSKVETQLKQMDGFSYDEFNNILVVMSKDEYEYEYHLLTLYLAMSNEDEEIAKTARENYNKIVEENRNEILAKIMTRTSKKTIKNLEEQAVRYLTNARIRKKDYIEQIENLDIVNKQIKNLKTNINEVYNNFLEQIERINEINNVEKISYVERGFIVDSDGNEISMHEFEQNKENLEYGQDYEDIKRVDKGHLRVVVNNIIMKAGERYYDLGQTFLDIDIMNSEVRIKAPTKYKRQSVWGASAHPHADNNGIVCWGNATETIDELIKEKEFAMLVEYLISFCQQANIEDSAGARAYLWDECEIDGSVRDERLKGAVQCSRCGISPKYLGVELINDKVVCQDCAKHIRLKEEEEKKEEEKIELIRCDVCSSEDVELQLYKNAVLCEVCINDVI